MRRTSERQITMTETVMQGKPYARNPHVRFGEGAGTPRHSGCSALLYSEPVTIKGLNPLCFQHPMDRIMLKRLKGIPFLPKLVGRVVDHITKETKLEFYGGGAIAVTQDSMPDLHTLFQDICASLDMPEPYPCLYVKADPTINAYTTGCDQLIVCATRALIDSCNEKELRFVLGHELGHCMCDHVVYHTLANCIANGLMFSLEAAALQLLRPILMTWARYSELSADRAGLLACQDLDATCSAFLKMSGLPFNAELKNSATRILSEQAKQFRREFGEFGFFRKLWMTAKHSVSATHPRPAERFEWLYEWRTIGYYDEILDATPTELEQIARQVDEDSERHDLLMSLAVETAQYLKENKGVSCEVSLPLLRKAYIFGNSLKGTPIEQLLIVELGVKRGKANMMEYTLEMHIYDKGGDVVKRVVMALPLALDWAHTPSEFRHKMIESRTNEIKVGIYSC